MCFKSPLNDKDELLNVHSCKNIYSIHCTNSFKAFSRCIWQTLTLLPRKIDSYLELRCKPSAWLCQGSPLRRCNRLHIPPKSPHVASISSINKNSTNPHANSKVTDGSQQSDLLSKMPCRCSSGLLKQTRRKHGVRRTPCEPSKTNQNMSSSLKRGNPPANKGVVMPIQNSFKKQAWDLNKAIWCYLQLFQTRHLPNGTPLDPWNLPCHSMAWHWITN